MTENEKIDNRLDDLFKDLEDQAVKFKTEKGSIPGWTWECDPQWIYTKCSPEISDILGVERENVIGESFFSFRINEKSISELNIIIEDNIFPIDIELEFINSNDEIIHVLVHIIPIESIDDINPGWRGYNSVILTDQETPFVADQQPVQKVRTLDRQTGQLLSFPSMGVAIENDQLFPIDRPSSSAGVVSLHKNESLSENGTTGSPAALAVPVDLQQQSLGILEIIDDSPDRTWSDEDQILVEQVANQLALALENARLFQETQVSLSRTEALYNVGQAAIGFENLEELLQGVVNTLANTLPADSAQATVFNLDKSQLTHYFLSYSPPMEFGEDLYQELMDGLTGWCVREREPALLSKGMIDPRESEAEQIFRTQDDIGSRIIAPMIYRDRTFGALSVANKNHQRDFSQTDVDLLVAMATQVATALANAQLFQEEQRRRQIADTLSETARVVGSSLELEDVGNSLLDQLADVIEFDNASLQIFEGKQRRIISGLSKIGPNIQRIEPGLVKTQWEQPLVNTLIETSQPLVIPNTQLDPRWPASQADRRIRSWIGAPLLSGGEAIGLLVLEHSESGSYDDDSADFISAIAAQVTAAIRNAGLFQQTQQRSVQLQTAAEVSRAASSILEPDPLIQQTVALIQERFNSYYVGLFLVDETGEWTNEPGRWAVLRAGTGEAGTIQLERRHKLEISGGSMIGNCIRSAEAQTPHNLSGDISRYVNPLLPNTQTEIALPLISRGSVIGAMSIQSEFENAFSTEDIAILQTMADQVANSLQNAYLFDQTQVRADELAVLNEMSRTLSEKLDVETTLRNVYLFASRLIDTSTFFIALHNENTDEISFPLSTEGNREIEIPTRQLGSGLTEYVINNREALLIKSDIEGWMVENGIKIHQTGDMPQSWLGAPMTIGAQNLGILCVQHQDPNRFTDHHKDILIAIANQSAIALQNAQLFTQTQEALSETEALLNITSAASSSFEIHETLTDVLNRVLQASTSTAGLITIANPDTDKLEIIVHNLPVPMLETLRKDGFTGSLTDWVYKQKTPIFIEDLSTQSPVDAGKILAQGFNAYQGVPIEAKGRILGALSTFSTQRLTTTDNDLSLLQAVGQQIGVAVENANLFEQIQEQAAELEILNEMSRSLSTQFNIDEITRTIHTYTSRLIDMTEFYVALYDQRDNEISYPFVFENGESTQFPHHTEPDGLTSNIIMTKQPLLIPENYKEKMAELSLQGTIITNNAETWMGVPLVIGEEILGVIGTQNSDTPNAFSTHHLDLLTTVARQSATAIQTSRLFDATRRQTDDLAVLNEMSRVLTNIIDREEILETVYEYTTRIMDTSNFMIATQNANQPVLRIEYSITDGQKTQDRPGSLNEELITFVLENGNSLLLEDDIPHHFENMGIRSHQIEGDEVPLSWLAAPMTVGDSETGVISLFSHSVPRLFDERHRDLLVAIASQTAISLQNAGLFEQTQQQLENLTLIQETTSHLSESLSFDDVCHALLTRVAQSTNSDASNLYILREKSLICEAAYPGHPDARIEKGDIIQLDAFPQTKEAIQTRRPIIIAQDDENLEESTRMALVDSGIDINAIVPMLGSEGVMGVISLDRNRPANSFTSQELNLVTTLASQAVIALENARLYEEQLETSEQLRELDQLKTQFLANMSHELRTPLNSIIGFSRVIMKGIDGPITDLQKQDLSAIYNAGQHLLKMINDILDISKIDAGKMELSFEDSNVVDIIESVMSTARGLVKDKPIELVTAIEDDIPNIQADSTRIRQVLLNLISNAAKFTNQGGITVTARQQIGAAGQEEIYISVKDTGSGIPEEDQEKLFEPFVQVDGSPTRATGGTGLGLSITRMLIELHNGSIGLESKVGHGSNFFFTLPVTSFAQTSTVIPEKLKILAIDDDSKIITLYEQYVADTNFQIISLNDPGNSTTFAREILPFAIMMEVNYSDHDGWAIIEELRSNPDTRQIPIVICSMEDNLKKGLELGVVDYLVKPILADDFVEALTMIKEKPNRLEESTN